MEHKDPYIGKMLDNRYEILERIGTGGMAIVYKAKCHRLNRLVAVKILKSDLAQDEDFRRRFNAESQAVAQLSHPNIVSVYDVSKGGDIEYIVMELIDGITLKQYMEKRGQLNWRESLHFITQIMRGLSHAHSRGIVHRDIKPQNVMVLRDGSVKVADFGIACLENAAQTLTQEALGSVHYISPEQARGDRTDARSDISSAGVVLYEMLTGRLPFEGDSAVSVAIQHLSSVPLAPREINPDIPEQLELICMKAMAPDLEKRYPSADAMIADLEAFRKNPGVNLDFELSDKQFQLRYTDEHGNLYTFPEKLYRVSLDCNSLLEADFEETIIGSIEQMALQTRCRIFIVDNLTYLCCAMEKGDAAGRLMIQLNNLKKRYDLSMLVLAHTPKRSLDCPITSNDLAGSKRLYNFFDSVFAIGKSAQDGGLRYVKQLKVRYGTYSYDADNVILYEIEKEDAFLQFVHRGYSTEKEHLKKLGDNESSQRDCMILQLSQSGKSVREIASQVNCGKSTVSRIIQRSKEAKDMAVPSVPPSQPTTSGTMGQDGTVGTIKNVKQAELFAGQENGEDKP